MPARKLKPNIVPEKPQQQISVDFIIKLLVLKDYDSILVVYNRFLKILHFVAITEKIMTERLVRLFRNNVWKLYELLEIVILNRELQFVAGLMKELNKMLRIKTKLSTAYHPQINRQIDKTNQELEQYLRIYVDYRQKNWLEQLATVKFIFNNKVHTATKSLSFKVNYGRKPIISFDIRKKVKHVKAEEFVKKIKNRHKKIKVALIKSQKEMKRYANRNRKSVDKYKGLSNRVDEKSNKKVDREIYQILCSQEIISENMVKLKLPALLRIYLVVNVRRIVKYQEQIEKQKKIPPSIVEIEKEKKYEVEKILDRQERKEKPKYLVRQKSYTTEKDIQERLENLKNVIDLVKEFKKEIREK